MFATDQPITRLLTSAFATAAASQLELQKKWISTLAQLCGYGALGMGRYQSDYRVDLLLRAFEAETLLTISRPPDPHTMFGPDLQFILSRYWVLSSYEALRMAKNTAKGKSDPTLRELYWKFLLVRIPIAKLEIAQDEKIKEPLIFETIGEGPKISPQTYHSMRQVDYHPPMSIDAATGSAAWHIYDRQTKSAYWLPRRLLSDEMLNLFD